jgi:aminopeptidase
MRISTAYAGQIARIEKLAARENLWQEKARDALTRAGQEHASTDDFLQLLQDIQRLGKIEAAGLENDQAFFDACAKEKLKTWKDFGAPPVGQELQVELAKKLYNIRPGTNDVGAIVLGSQSRQIGRWLAEKCAAEGAPFLAQFDDPTFGALVLNHATVAGVENMAAAHVENMKPINRLMQVPSGIPDEKPAVKADKEKSQVFSRALVPYSSRVSSGEIFYTLTVIPTRKDAELDGIEYGEYLNLFFEMCDQPWEQVGKAQENLIAEFNAASKVRITNSDGTDISMSLIDDDGSHFTFCNSLIAKNVPGSEIFSAPRLDSVEGVVVAKGRFSPKDDDNIVENLTMEFRQGKLVRYSAEKGLDVFEKTIGVDEGASRIGELGIGTNPRLQQHVANGLLVEKIGGSFHLALGRCYTYTEYQGEPVKVDNGNESALHWDVTTMLVGKEGRIYLDGRLVMDGGKWLDKKYDVLNRGWAAVPEKDRPARWKNFKPG